MAEALTLATDKVTFDVFLRNTYGIEGNIFTVKQARSAAMSGGSGWADFCTSWGHEDALHPSVQVRALNKLP